MTDIAIRAEKLSKHYRIGEFQRYKALRDTLTDALYAPFRAAASLLSGRWSPVLRQPSNNYIWALKDVSFEVKQGEVIGIIGRNGAGKSTLLKILSRITDPTEGYAEIRGRVGSLLEVGTGFHPELTGRENIYLSGAILGMKKAEVKRKFDEIVAFAEIEKFLDTPVKHYSSGMYVRLPFAVAAHLEPEILLVDEILAVGDYEFQKKCLGKMGAVGQEGRSVLFVSHNLAAMRKLCPKAILIDKGEVKAIGQTNSVINEYIHNDEWSTVERFFNAEEEFISDGIRLFSVRVLNGNHVPNSAYFVENPVYIEIEFQVEKLLGILAVSLQLFKDGVLAFPLTAAEDILKSPLAGKTGRMRVTAKIPENLLNVGFYDVEVEFGVGYGHVLGRRSSIVSFQTAEKDDLEAGDGFSFSMKHRRLPGAVRPKVDWQCEYLGM